MPVFEINEQLELMARGVDPIPPKWPFEQRNRLERLGSMEAPEFFTELDLEDDHAARIFELHVKTQNTLVEQAGQKGSRTQTDACQ